MNRKIIITQDGSHSIMQTCEFPEPAISKHSHIRTFAHSHISYHSIYGAIQESMHVFIDSGLKPLLHAQQEVYVFEMGFGTGLNALLTLLYAEKEKKKIYYHTVEAFPLDNYFVEEINYCTQLNRRDLQTAFEQLHNSEWSEDITISPYFNLHKANADFNYYETGKKFHLIYYDAFDPESQPGLWTLPVFKKLFMMLLPGGSLLTYCSKGAVRRIMQEAGFAVEKLPGPAHKREIIRAIK